MPTKLDANASFRKPRLVFLVLALALIFSAVCVGGVSGETWSNYANTTWYYDPDATEYNITNAADLAEFSNLVRGGTHFNGKTIYLVNDIDLSGHRWLSIGFIRGNLFVTSSPFKGFFDGNGKTISNISQTIGSFESGGLFGYVEGGTVTNVTLKNVEINVQASPILVGSLVGVLENGTVTDCEISGNYTIKPSGGAGSFTNSGNVTVDDVIGDIRGDISIYGITSTNMNISYGRISEIGVTVDYKYGGNHRDTEPTYPEPTYKVIIPEELEIDETGTGTIEIYVSDLPPSSIVKVYVSGDYVNENFSLKHQADSGVTLAYVLSNETVTKLSTGDLVGTFTSQNQNPIILTAKVSGPTLYSGTYTDKLTFTCGLE